MENDASSKSLFQCFVEGKRCLQKLEDIAALDPHYEPTLRKGIEHLRAAMQMINKFGLFSANEEAEDIKTASLKYLTVPYYLGLLYAKVNKMEERAQSIIKAKDLLSNFLENCKQVGLVPKEELEALERKQKPNRETERAEKVARHKRKAEATTKLNEIIQMKKKALSSPDADPDEEESPDEELEREMSLRMIQVAIPVALEEIGMIIQEVEVLQHMVKLNFEREKAKRTGAPQKTEDKPPAIAPKEIEFFQIDKRMQVQRKVFTPHWIQPTMTVEEAGEIEFRIAAKQQREQKQREEEERKRKEEGPEEDSDEEGIYKKRDWDDFKDNNPKGSGNTGNKGYVY